MGWRLIWPPLGHRLPLRDVQHLLQLRQASPQLSRALGPRSRGLVRCPWPCPCDGGNVAVWLSLQQFWFHVMVRMYDGERNMLAGLEFVGGGSCQSGRPDLRAEVSLLVE